MLEVMFYLLLVIAVILLLFIIEYYNVNDYWHLVFVVLGIILWFILSLSVMKLERPWTMYNSSSGAVETGIYDITSPVSPYISYLFTGVAIILVIYFVVILFDMFKTKRGY